MVIIIIAVILLAAYVGHRIMREKPTKAYCVNEHYCTISQEEIAEVERMLFATDDKEESPRIVHDDTRRNVELLPHILLWGPPGTGKTTMARVITNEIASIYGFIPKLIELTPMQLKDDADVLKLVRAIEFGTIIFIDEIHGIPKTCAEALYNMLEYCQFLDGNGRATVLPAHTVIGATTEPGTLEEPFRERFKLEIELDMLTPLELADIMQDINNGVSHPTTFTEYKGQDHAKMLVQMQLCALNEPQYMLPEDIIHEVAKRAIGVPRIAKNIARHLVTLARALGRGITLHDAETCFQLLGIDSNGLHASDRRVIQVLIKRGNKPMGVAALAGAAGVAKSDLERMIESRLVRLGYMVRTPRGRMLTDRAMEEYSQDRGVQ